MATTLLMKSNEINQLLANKLFPLPLGWDPKTKLLVSNKNRRKTVCGCSLHHIVVVLVVLLICITITYSSFISSYYPSVLDTKNLIVVTLFGAFVAPAVLLGEYGWTKFAVEGSGVINWGIQRQLGLKITEIQDVDLKTAITSELSKFVLGESETRSNIDWFGIMALNIIYNQYVLLGMVLPTILVYSDMDISYIWLYSLSSDKLLSWPRYYENQLLKLIRALIHIFWMECAVAFMATTLVFNIDMFQLMIFITKYMSNLNTVNYSALQLYREFFLGLVLLEECGKLLNIVFLSVVFFIIIFGVNITLLGFSVLPLHIYFYAPFITIMMLVILDVGLTVEGYIYYNSKEILDRWNFKLVRGKHHPLYVKKILKSFRPAYVSVANFGIVDRDLKVGYLQTVLEYSINLLMILKV